MLGLGGGTPGRGGRFAPCAGTSSVRPDVIVFTPPPLARISSDVRGGWNEPVGAEVLSWRAGATTASECASSRPTSLPGSLTAATTWSSSASFWLSHVPPGRFEPFWSLAADCLKPQGRVFFADDAYRTPDELVEGPASPVIRRQLNDGSSYRLVKVPHQPADLQEQLRRIGWHITVTPTAGPFYWGAGSRSGPQTSRHRTNAAGQGTVGYQGTAALARRSPQPAHEKRHS